MVYPSFLGARAVALKEKGAQNLWSRVPRGQYQGEAQGFVRFQDYRFTG